MGFLKKLFGSKPKLKYLLIAESPSKKINKMVGHAFLNKKLEDRKKLKERLEKHGAKLIHAVQKLSKSKKKRVNDIKKAYPKIKEHAEGSLKILLLHDYLHKAIGKELRKDFPHLEVHNIGFSRSYNKFKEKVKDALPLFFINKKL